MKMKEEADDAEAMTAPWSYKASLRMRLKHFTFAQFMMPLSTGGIGLVLAATPHRFDGLTTIGKIFFISALVMFVVDVIVITMRFLIHRGTFQRALMHPTEALFIPTVLLTFANLIAGAQAYGAPHCGAWFPVAMVVIFWIYVALAFSSAVIQYFHLFCGPVVHLTIQSMTPAWILPIFPIMISGTIAQAIAPDQPPERALPIIIGALAFQGLGWMVAFLMFAAYLHRLMQFGLPAPNLRPAMFISVGPSSFTGLSLIGFGRALPEGYGYFASHPYAINILRTLADFSAMFLWALGFWFFCITLVALSLGARKMSFHMVWWGAVFPNAGFTIATIFIGEQLESEGILWVGSLMTILLVAVWTFVFVSHVRAVLRQDIMMPGKDEDKVCYKDDDEKHGVAAPAPPKMPA